jgi:hypothetical protein
MCELAADEPAAVPLSELPAHTGEFLFVDGPNLVLSPEAQPGWAIGALFEAPGTADFRAGKRAWMKALPWVYPAMATRSYDLYGPGGKVCTARVGELRVIAQYEGWTVENIEGYDFQAEFGDEWEEPLPTTPKLRRALWQTQARWLVGELIPEGDCEGALWARDSELPAPTILRQSEADSDLGEGLIAAFEGSDAYAELEAAHRADWDDLQEQDQEWYPSWESIVEDAPAEVHSWLDGAGEPRVLELEFGYSEGCGGPDARYTSVHEVDGEGRVVDAEVSYGAEAIFDADLDGKFEYLHRDFDYSSAGWRRHLDSASEHFDVEIALDSDFYCPC